VSFKDNGFPQKNLEEYTNNFFLKKYNLLAQQNAWKHHFGIQSISCRNHHHACRDLSTLQNILLLVY
jgi:hypothetical protein